MDKNIAGKLDKVYTDLLDRYKNSLMSNPDAKKEHGKRLDALIESKCALQPLLELITLATPAEGSDNYRVLICAILKKDDAMLSVLIACASNMLSTLVERSIEAGTYDTMRYNSTYQAQREGMKDIKKG